MLTKSLHTITAATNVAAYLLTARPDLKQTWHAATLAGMALSVLGYTFTKAQLTADSDPTVSRIVANCADLIAKGAQS